LERRFSLFGKKISHWRRVEISELIKKSSESYSCDNARLFRLLAPELLSMTVREKRDPKNAVDIDGGFVVFREGWVSAATGAGGQIADLESEIRVFRKGDQ
jgi:hypothetical protein